MALRDAGLRGEERAEAVTAASGTTGERQQEPVVQWDLEQKGVEVGQLKKKNSPDDVAPATKRMLTGPCAPLIHRTRLRRAQPSSNIRATHPPRFIAKRTVRRVSKDEFSNQFKRPNRTQAELEISGKSGFELWER
jgi:hypothetical protein